MEEDLLAQQFDNLVDLFPDVCPEYLHAKAVELAGNEGAMIRWIDQTLEATTKDLPTRKDYEKRKEEAELIEKYSTQLTVEEILTMYDNDPESYFMDGTRKVSELYKEHSKAHLKREFRYTSMVSINKVFDKHSGLYLPCFRALSTCIAGKRKTQRKDHEAPLPSEADFNFLKELQYCRKDAEVRQHLDQVASERQKMLEMARASNSLCECPCCGNDECLAEEMLPCPNDHNYCKECIQRACTVAIGDGLTELKCLMHCDKPFTLASLQAALGKQTFLKWLKKIQIAEIEKAGLSDLEQCPFCPFATIMDVPKEINKLFECQNPECGEASCRLCREVSHIPLRCEEVEKDDEVRMRTYIENKMAEAMIRSCYNCNRPYIKQDGCNKITCCNCGALMCYICRLPVKDYNHFYGQGSEPVSGKCPLWTDNNLVHDRDVALGALEAQNALNKNQPGVILKNDPTKGLNMANAQAPIEALIRPPPQPIAQHHPAQVRPPPPVIPQLFVLRPPVLRPPIH